MTKSNRYKRQDRRYRNEGGEDYAAPQENQNASGSWDTWLEKKKEKTVRDDYEEPRWPKSRSNRGDREEPRWPQDNQGGTSASGRRRRRERDRTREWGGEYGEESGGRWKEPQKDKWSELGETRWLRCDRKDAQEKNTDRHDDWRESERRERAPRTPVDRRAERERLQAARRKQELARETPQVQSDEDDEGSEEDSESETSSSEDSENAADVDRESEPSSSQDSDNQLGFGVIVYDLETIHDAERGTYMARGIHECSYEDQITWKRQSQIIEFAAVDIVTGRHICVRSRPEFHWSDVRSLAARLFAEDHGHDQIVKDETLPYFGEVWIKEILPWLQSVAGQNLAGVPVLGIIAHNGDNFDHFVLEKELTRLGLMKDMPIILHKFDPIRTLKNAFGQEFGSGGRLTLQACHHRHVRPAQPGEKPKHQAMADCTMLLEVITHWAVLRSLMSAEIAVSFAEFDDVEEVCNMLVSSMIARCAQPLPSSTPTPAAASSAAASSDGPERPAQPSRKSRERGAAAAAVDVEHDKGASKDEPSRDSAWASWNNGGERDRDLAWGSSGLADSRRNERRRRARNKKGWQDDQGFERRDDRRDSENPASSKKEEAETAPSKRSGASGVQFQ